MFQNFKKFLNDRVNEIGNNIVIKDKEYQELTEQSIKVYCQIRDTLPGQYKELINEYESINSLKECISEEIIYEHGFGDGIRLNEIIKSIKESAEPTLNERLALKG
jgi:hypothetical protein